MPRDGLSKRALRLKALYGIKQAGRAWYLTKKFLLELFEQNDADPCMFQNGTGDNDLYHLIRRRWCNSCKNWRHDRQAPNDVQKRFKITTEPFTSHLGMQLQHYQNGSDSTPWEIHSKYQKEIGLFIVLVSMKHHYRTVLSLRKNHLPSKRWKSRNRPWLEPVDDSCPYPNLIGALLYAAITVRVDSPRSLLLAVNARTNQTSLENGDKDIELSRPKPTPRPLVS